MIIKNVRQFGYFKTRPKSHKLEGITTKQHSGMVLSSYPKKYPMNAPQKKVKAAGIKCGLHKGMSRSELVNTAMPCIKKELGTAG